MEERGHQISQERALLRRAGVSQLANVPPRYVSVRVCGGGSGGSCVSLRKALRAIEPLCAHVQLLSRVVVGGGEGRGGELLSRVRTHVLTYVRTYIRTYMCECEWFCAHS